MKHIICFSQLLFLFIFTVIINRYAKAQDNPLQSRLTGSLHYSSDTTYSNGDTSTTTIDGDGLIFEKGVQVGGKWKCYHLFKDDDIDRVYTEEYSGSANNVAYLFKYSQEGIAISFDIHTIGEYKAVFKKDGHVVSAPIDFDFLGDYIHNSAKYEIVNGNVTASYYWNGNGDPGQPEPLNKTKISIQLSGAIITPTPNPTATSRPVPTATPKPTATITPRPTATPKPVPPTTPDPKPLIGIDFGRDGSIDYDKKDKTSADKPFQFWLNDDHDGYDKDDKDQKDLNPANGPNYADVAIPVERDLEDFSRLSIQAPSDFSPGGNWRCTLKFASGSPAIRVWRAVSTDTKYLTDPDTATKQIGVKDNWRIESSEVDIPLTLFTPTSSKYAATLLFEGFRAGRGSLQVCFYKDDKARVADNPVWLDLHRVQDFYDYYLVKSVNSNGSTKTYQQILANSTITAAQTSDYILFVHGWRMQEWNKKSFAETAFKRLWHRGYKGRFGLFSWPTDYTPLIDVPLIGRVPQDPTNYDRSEQIAWLSARPLRALLTSLNGRFPQKVRVLAHSMGNVVTSEALLQEAESKAPQNLVQTYIATQAAVPAQAYDAKVGNKRAVPHLLYSDSDPNVYKSYPLGLQPYFSGTKNNGGIKAITNHLVNYFNSKDYALSSWWRFNQPTKPDTGYGYDIISVPLNSKGAFYEGTVSNGILFGSVLTFPNDRYEIFAHVAPAFSLPLGAQRVNGPFSLNVDLQSQFGFTDKPSDHSAQFNSTIMKRRSYWDQVLTNFGISYSPPK